jgi:hypothetical protein
VRKGKQKKSSSDYIDLSPSPSSLIESLRDIGYSIETAIADVIDNSITATSSRIDVRFSWNDGTPWLAIVDDGYGMSYEELESAMRFGSMSPLATRSRDDLGRFGLGLKTASFSQCRCLTVFSKKDEDISCCQWDLDSISNSNNNEWLLRIVSKEEIADVPVLKCLEAEYLKDLKAGTIVLWNSIDRLDAGSDSEVNESKFHEALVSVREHLELVFHRFISPDPGQSKVRFSFNNDELEAFDPFNSTKSTERPNANFKCEGENIHVQPYVLPRHNKVSKSEWRKYEGQLGYLHEQGFYVYRNRRLIIKGTWFRLMPKAELTKLLRVKVDIPNSLDYLWKIDVKKSHASPPFSIRKELKNIIGQIEIDGKRVITGEGQRLRSFVKEPSWNRIATNNQVLYEINKDHTLIKDFCSKLGDSERQLFEHILSTLENSFPREAFFKDVASTPEQVETPPLKKEQIEIILDFFIGTTTPTKERLKELIHIDPFVSNKECAEKIFKERGYEY